MDTKHSAVVKIQSAYRGYKTRAFVVHRARNEFEEILKEIEGELVSSDTENPWKPNENESLLKLSWPRKCVCLPQFIDPSKPSSPQRSPKHFTRTQSSIHTTTQSDNINTNNPPSPSLPPLINPPNKNTQSTLTPPTSPSTLKPILESKQIELIQDQHQNANTNTPSPSNYDQQQQQEHLETFDQVLSSTIHEIIIPPSNQHKDPKIEHIILLESSYLNTNAEQPTNTPLENTELNLAHSTKPSSVRVQELESELEWVRIAIKARKQYLKVQTQTKA